jgi:signal transduction histidine kinase/ActR/RegA family two-component response regulator
VIEAVVDVGMAATVARSGGLWILADDGARVSLVRNVGPTGPTADRFTDIPLDQPLRMPILDAIRTGTPIWIESCRQMEELYPAVLRAFSSGAESSLACLPLFAQGRCIGGLAFNHAGVRRFLEDERAFLQVLSWYSAQAIERGRLYAREREARAAAETSDRRSQFLAATSMVLASSLDLPATLTGLAQAAVPGVADWCIVEIHEEREKGRPAVSAHVDPSKAEHVLDLSQRYRATGGAAGIPGVMKSGRSLLYKTIVMSEVRKRLPADLCDLYEQIGLASAMVVPIAAHGRTLGAILLVSASAEHVYDDQDLAMAEELGRRAGIAVENARLYGEVREADRQKDEFLAMLGHELRNPLSPILVALDLMNLAGGDTFARERRIITRSVQHVLRLVDDLLDVSRITRGKIRLRKERVDVAQVIAKAVEMTSPHFESRDQPLTIGAPAGLTVFADPARLAQAIANLLTNAAKYTEPRGAISITAATEGNELCVRVRDAGIGIAPEVLRSVFELFVQADSSLDRAQGGLGIGLTIVRNLVELHGGTVSAASAGLGKGSEFTIRLPLAIGLPVEQPEDGEASRAPTAASGAALRVLVVDDNLDLAEVLALALRGLGCTTTVVQDGASALTAAAELEPHLALVDIGLPVMDGYEVVRRLRQMESTTRTRIIAITGYGQLADRRRSLDAGFDEHVVKPIGIEDLRAILDRLTRARA